MPTIMLPLGRPLVNLTYCVFLMEVVVFTVRDYIKFRWKAAYKTNAKNAIFNTKRLLLL